MSATVALALIATAVFISRLESDVSMEKSAPPKMPVGNLDSPKPLSVRSELRSRIIAEGSRLKYRDLEHELRAFAGSDATSSAKLSILELLSKSGIDSLEFEKAVALFCTLETDTAFRLSAIQLIKTGSNKSGITRMIFSSSTQEDFPKLADELNRINNDDSRRILVRHLIGSILPESSPSTLYQWIKSNLDEFEQPTAMGTLFSLYADQLEQSGEIDDTDFPALTEQFPREELLPVAKSQMVSAISRNDTSSILRILGEYEPSAQWMILEDAMHRIDNLPPAVSSTLLAHIQDYPEDSRASLSRHIEEKSK